MRRAALIALVIVLAGCGGGSKSARTTAPVTTAPVTTTSGDPGKAAADAFLAAAAAGNVEAIWGMLSAASQRRLGPTLGEFKSGAGGELADSVGSFRGTKVIVSERITPEFGVVAIDGRQNGKPAVYAVPLRLEGTKWRLELGSPVKVRPIGPDPGAHEQIVAQVAAAVSGPGGSGTAVMYLDGHTENPKVAGTASNSTLYANFEPALDPGHHTVVVFASDGQNAGATAWDFTAAK